MSPTEMAYRKMAIGGASGFGLLVALYDTLAGDLRRAAEAERSNDLENRTKEVNHALLVVAYLEEYVQRGSGGKLADYLISFYKSLRGKMIEAQVKRSAEILEEQMAQVLKIREIWQRFELGGSSSKQEARAWAPPASYPNAPSARYEHSASGWSA
ncbi:MAG: flagellar export chaperone FliS [Terracidiphilus sp.]